MFAQLMTCLIWLYGQLLITKPLDSFCLYLVLSSSWLCVSSGLQKGLFPYLGCHSLHPLRSKGHRRLSVFISRQPGQSVAVCVLRLLCCWLWGWDKDQGLASVKFRFEDTLYLFCLFVFQPLQKARVDTTKQQLQYRRCQLVWCLSNV